MVLTGGTSLLPGIRDLASEVLELPVRAAGPEGLRGLVDQLHSPAFSASLGLLHWARMQDEQATMDTRVFNGFRLPRFSLGQAAELLRKLLPG